MVSRWSEPAYLFLQAKYTGIQILPQMQMQSFVKHWNSSAMKDPQGRQMGPEPDLKTHKSTFA